MARIANVNIPDNKRILISLTYIYGIGKIFSKSICDSLNIDYNLRIKDIPEEDLIKIRKHISDNYLVEGDLRREVSLNIKKKKDIRCYQGIRHVNKLPVRGQNTKSNARTRKGKSVAIAGKKKPAAKK